VRDVAQGVVKAGVTFPRRIYLDTGTLQTTYDYGKTLWENELFEPLPRDVKVPGLADEVTALRNIFLVDVPGWWKSPARPRAALIGRRRRRRTRPAGSRP